jgi:iron complex transport system ATP-binding protein
MVASTDPGQMTDEPLLEASQVTASAGGKEILKGVDLSLRRGELVAVVGPNGAGKSTFARVACGLMKSTGGEVSWAGRNLRDLKGRDLARIRAFVPQRAQVPTGVTVEDAVRIGRSSHLRPLQGLTARDREAIDNALSRARMGEFRGRLLTTLSGGELQRVQVAVGLAQETLALVADEPTAQLDLGATADVSKLMRELVDDGMGVLLIVHDLALAAAVADQCVVISEGASIATGAPHEVLQESLIAEVWGVEAELVERDGRSALHVGWLDRAAEEQSRAAGRLDSAD